MTRYPRSLIALLLVLIVSAGAAAQNAAGDDSAREAEWRKLFAEGVAAFQQRDEDAAIEKWEAANRVYDRPEGYNNIAVILEQRGDYGRAAQMYVQALAVLSRMRAPLDSEREERLATRRDVHQGLLGSADELFRLGKLPETVEALQALTAADPTSRDALYTLGLTLARLERWTDLVPVAERLVSIDPLNSRARTLLLNASRGDAAAIQAQKAAVNRLPVYLDDLAIVRAASGVTLRGTVTGAAAAAGTPVRLEIMLYDTGEPAGTHTVVITAPAKDAKAPLAATIQTPATVTSFSYRSVE